MQDVHLRKLTMDTLLGYSPFWLRLGLEVVLGKHISLPASSSSATQQIGILRVVLGDAFLADEALAASHSFNQTRRGLQTAAYWVSTCGASHALHCLSNMTCPGQIINFI